MKRMRTRLLLIAVWMLAGARPCLAQVDEGFNAQNFQPPIDSFGYITMNGARHLRAPRERRDPPHRPSLAASRSITAVFDAAPRWRAS